jgi:hypothetical protein
MNVPASPPPEPRNWFFTFLVPAGVVFVVTALAYAIIPTLEDRAAHAGSAPPTSAIREALREDGWWWLLIEAGVIVVLSLAAMIWDQLVIQPRRQS